MSEANAEVIGYVPCFPILRRTTSDQTRNSEAISGAAPPKPRGTSVQIQGLAQPGRPVRPWLLQGADEHAGAEKTGASFSPRLPKTPRLGNERE